MSHHPVKRATAGRVVLLLLVFALLVAAVAAVPAMAASTPTTLNVTAQKPSVNWGATAILNGVLQTNANPPVPVDQQQVLVQFATTSNAILWTTAATVTNTAAPYSSGAYTYSFTASRNLYWRMSFAGTTEWAHIDSNVVYVQVKAVVGKPSCPSSAKHGKKFTVSGSLKPLFPAGTSVQVKAQKYAHGKWRAYKTYTATTANSGSFSKYSVKLSISSKGKYRFSATSAATSTLAAGTSAYSRSLRIK